MKTQEQQMEEFRKVLQDYDDKIVNEHPLDSFKQALLTAEKRGYDKKDKEISELLMKDGVTYEELTKDNPSV